MYNRWKLKAKQLSDLTGLCYLYISTLIYRAKKRPSNLHEISDFGIGEGVPLQSVLNATPAHRDRARPLPHGASDQNLVPEPPHEVQEGQQTAQHEERETKNQSSRSHHHFPAQE